LSIVINIFTYTLSKYAGIPYVLIILLILVLGYSFVMNRMVVGRRIYAVGGNESAAQLSGIKTKKVKFCTFVNMGVLASLAGLIFTGSLNAASPHAGYLFVLVYIAAEFF